MASVSQKGINWGRLVVVGVPYLWLLAFFLIPLLIVLKLSFSQTDIAIPPYTPQLDWREGWEGFKTFYNELSAANYTRLLDPNDFDYDPLNVVAYFSSVRIALVSTLIVLLIGYPLAYGMARSPKSWRPILMILVILPFFSSLLIRVYSWIAILKPEGFLNLVLSWVGIVQTRIDEAGNSTFVNPLQIADTEWAVYIGIVYSYLPFMVLPLYAVLEKMDDTLLEAAQDLGCTRLQAFWKVTFPLSIPGIIAGCMLVFIPAIGEYIVPAMLGGADTLMIGRQLVNEFEKNRDWPFAAAFAVLLLLLLIIPIIYYQNLQAKQLEAGK
jgi:putrescine transport system permease protein